MEFALSLPSLTGVLPARTVSKCGSSTLHHTWRESLTQPRAVTIGFSRKLAVDQATWSGDQIAANSITLLQQSSRKLQKRLDIVEIGNGSDRNAHGARSFAVDAMAEIIDGQAVFVFGLCETDIQFHA